MLEAINLSKRYGEQDALRGLNLSVSPGDLVCLLGANGAGKTTTINLFMGFIEASTGQVLVNGHDVAKAPAASKKHLAYIPENLHLYSNLSGVENLQFFAGLSGSSIKKEAAQELLHTAGLQGTAFDKRVSTYSKGMRQKVGIAIAKAKQADNLLLDEPSSGLDPQASNEFARLLEDMRAQNAAILMATHDLFRAKSSSTHIGIMKAGSMLHFLKTEDISLSELEHLYLETMQTNSYDQVSA